ncbi:MAG: hypothetical protein ACJ8AG_06760 [Ktedonobacteraceae bacterium]
MQSERGSRQQAKKIKAFHLVVEGYRLPNLLDASGFTKSLVARIIKGELV